MQGSPVDLGLGVSKWVIEKPRRWACSGGGERGFSNAVDDRRRLPPLATDSTLERPPLERASVPNSAVPWTNKGGGGPEGCVECIGTGRLDVRAKKESDLPFVPKPRLELRGALPP
jgi:hypothetical protein